MEILYTYFHTVKQFSIPALEGTLAITVAPHSGLEINQITCHANNYIINKWIKKKCFHPS